MSEEDSAANTIAIDKVRASKAGHAYHEAWAARTALELLLPSTDLTAITLEGFAEQDEQELGTGAVEIADLVRYHGGTDVARSHRVTVVQFKYSIASAGREVRAADLVSTLVKFAITDTELRAAHGDEHVEKVVRYEFATNRPIHENLGQAIAAIAAGSDVDGDVSRQADQIVGALQNYPHKSAELLRRLDLVGSKGSLVDAERQISATLAAWSEPGDPDAEKRLLKLRNLIRIKAGPGSETDKAINRVAVLAELEVEHEDRLYPTPDAFPEVNDVVQRAVLDDILAQARLPGAPLIVHAAGGMGKTVLMQGLAERLRADGPVVLFDGFGAGRWRDPADGRHLPERTLVHLANLLAGEGLCDILLPVADVTSLLRAFRRRIAQSVATARNTNPEACLSLVLDAIDHAGLAAKETATLSFAHRLLRSVSVDPIDGVRLIASCRTERLSIAIGDIVHRDFPIPLFTDFEARTLIARRVPDASEDEVAALLTRSGRNPRCLDNLIETGRPFDPFLFPDAAVEPHDVLDSLLRKRLQDARKTANARGVTNADIDLLLAGIAILAPPVPIEELAAAHGLISEEVESFAADLAPLLERTPHGLMFRDEPTETLIRSAYPYRDGPAYLARAGFWPIFYISDSLGALDPSLAKRMVDWLATAPGFFIPELTQAVTRLSRVRECHDAALALAGHVERKIQLDTNVNSRVTAYGCLARAVWRVGTAEATAYLRRALDLTEAIGSDDFDRTNHLLELTGHYSGPELPAEAAHTLARILELNQGEDGRFPWIEYAQTMVPIAGVGVLAMLARLDDRNVARLGLSLGPALTVLTQQSKLPAATASALFGLAAPGEAWTWHISDFASEAIKTLPQHYHEWFFNLLLVEIDRDDQLTPARKTIEGLHRLAEQKLPATSVSRLRIEGLLTRLGQESAASPPAPSIAVDLEPPPTFPIDLSDPIEIDRQILSEEIDHAGRRWPIRTLLDLAKRTTVPAERLGFVRAVVESSAATLADKVSVLDSYVEEWSKTSAAMCDALPELGLRLASKHAAELAGSSSNAWGAWRSLETHFRADRVALVEEVVAGLRGVAEELGGNAWLALAARLAADVSNQAIADGLERFLASSAAKLPTEVGDGPWDIRLSIPADEAELIAGFVWSRLGHPIAAMRWRAAHAVRRLAAIRRFDVLDQLIARFGLAAQLDRGVEDDREAEDEDQTVEEAGALKHCRFPFAERNCSTNGGRLTFRNHRRQRGDAEFGGERCQAIAMGRSLAADRTGFIAAAIIDIASAILALDPHDHSPLSVIAQRQRLPAPLPICRIGPRDRSVVFASSGRNPQGRDSFSWLGERSE